MPLIFIVLLLLPNVLFANDISDSDNSEYLDLSVTQITQLKSLNQDYEAPRSALLLELDTLESELLNTDPLMPGYIEWVAQISRDKAIVAQSLDNLLAEQLMKTHHILTDVQRQKLQAFPISYPKLGQSPEAIANCVGWNL